MKKQKQQLKEKALLGLERQKQINLKNDRKREKALYVFRLLFPI